MKNTAEKIIRRGEPFIAVKADYIYKDSLKAMGGRWNPEARAWELPYNPETWQSLYLTIPGIAASEEIRAELYKEEQVPDKPLRDAPPMPIKPGIKPFRHQLAAYADALYILRKGACNDERWIRPAI